MEKKFKNKINKYNSLKEKKYKKENIIEKEEGLIEEYIQNKFMDKYFIWFIISSVPVAILSTWFVMGTSFFDDGVLRFLVVILSVMILSMGIKSYLKGKIMEEE